MGICVYFACGRARVAPLIDCPVFCASLELQSTGSWQGSAATSCYVSNVLEILFAIHLTSRSLESL